MTEAPALELEAVERGYAYWLAKLAGDDPDPPADRTIMPLGFFRMQNNAPLAVWIDADSGARVAMVGFKTRMFGFGFRYMSERRMEQVAEQGGFGKAVTEEAYREAFEAGRWSDEPPLVATIGDNSRIDDPCEAMRAELAGEEETTAEFLARPIATQADADMCSTWARRVGLLMGRADKAREEEKAPHLTASREVDDKWRPIVTGAKELSAMLKRHVEPWLIAEKRKAEGVARAATEIAAKLRAAAAFIADEDARAETIRQAQQAEKIAEPKNATAGRTGMKVALRTERRARIVDYDAALSAVKDTTEVRAVVEALANRAVRAGLTMAGVEVEITEKAA